MSKCVDLIGKKFNKLLVLDKSHRVNNVGQRNGRIWKCQCDCGNTREVFTNDLNSNRITSCGCDNFLGISSNTKFQPKISSLRAKLSHYKSNAKLRNKEFSISFEQGTKLLTGNCHYCGSEPNMEFSVLETRKSAKRVQTGLIDKAEYIVKTNGLDRIDNSKGYIENNVVSCCTICNYAKNTLSYNDFLLWIDKLISYRSSL